MANKSKIASFTIKVNTENGKVKIDGVTKSFQKAENAYKKLDSTINNGGAAAGIDNLANKATNLKNASGGAAATVTEMGRAISDAPYGIRGVANNLSQLSSQFVNTMRTAGGFSAAMKSMWTAMMGPLGILIAIQAGLALLEAWSMKAKEASLSLSDVFSNAVTETSAKLMLLQKTIKSTNLTLEEKQHVLSTAKEEMADLGITVDDTATNFDALDAVLEANIKVMMKRAIAQAFLNEMQEAANDVAKTEVSTIQENLVWYEKATLWMTKHSQTMGLWAWTAHHTAENAMERREETTEKHKDRMERVFDELSKKLEDGDMYLNHLFGKDDKDGSKARNRAMKIFKAGYLDLLSVVRANDKASVMRMTKNEVELLELEKHYADLSVQDKYDKFVEKQELRHKDYLASIKGHAKEAELAADANAKFKESMIKAETELGDAKMAIRINYAHKIHNKENEIRLALMGAAADADLTNSTNIFKNIDPDSFPDAQGYVDYLNPERAAKRTSLEANLADAEEFGNEEAIFSAQQELNDFNQQLRIEDIENELAYYDNKRSIATEYVGFLQQTSQLFKALAGDNEKLQKAALIMEKSAATANVIVQTQGAIASRRAGNLMMAAMGPAGVKAAALDKIPMAADIARMKIGAGLSIANIWATGWGSKSVKGSGSDSGASKGREFDFNLVGSTGQNQLAQATAGQLNQPVQAYVVSSAMTSQQQMDNAIQTNASFGDDD